MHSSQKHHLYTKRDTGMKSGGNNKTVSFLPWKLIPDDHQQQRHKPSENHKNYQTRKYRAELGVDGITSYGLVPRWRRNKATAGTTVHTVVPWEKVIVDKRNHVGNRRKVIADVEPGGDER
ncbi:hypothetical protein EDD22DRAFT_850883 [Suillus occidentalis]|nr:hypothetical protein EDD22DRAFT_850883 [Suillus occidentalis]